MSEVTARIAQRVAAWRTVCDVHLSHGAVTSYELDAGLVDFCVSRCALRDGARPHANRGVVAIDNYGLCATRDVAPKVVHLHVAWFAGCIARLAARYGRNRHAAVGDRRGLCYT
jgi:hypothetical protein